jgi:tetratricopeptide (TPR) repeat protein
MFHLGPEVMRRILKGEGGAQESEKAAEHITSCERCRTEAGTLIDELRAASPGLQGEGPLRLVFGLIDRERQWGVDALVALAEWAELRRLPNRRGQRDRVRMAKACHTLAFFDLLLGELKEAPSWEDAEFFAALALLSVEAMSQRKLTRIATSDLQAKVWTAVANARRRAAEWKKARQALANAERLLRGGTGDPLLEAERLSILGSTLADEGQASQALDALETCRTIYDGLSEWALLARTLIQMANILVGTEPAKSLQALDHASPLIPAEDSYLMLLAELLRVECLIEVRKPSEALRVYKRCARLLIANPRIRMRLRGKFTSARLLDALGFKPQAERLFDEVVDGDIEHELYKDAFLDLLYLYGVHMEAGNLEKAARVCRRALTDSALVAIAHDQLRTLWTQLLEAAQRRAIRQDLLKDLRRYLSVHWKHPAAQAPVVIFQ